MQRASPSASVMALGSWAVRGFARARDRQWTKAVSLYLASNRDHFLTKLPPSAREIRTHRAKEKRRNELLRHARRAFRLESADVRALYFRKAGAGATVVRRRLRGKQSAYAPLGLGGIVAAGGIDAYLGGVEASGGIQASHGVAKSAPTTPPIRCRPSTPGPVQWQTRCEEVPSMKGDLRVPDAHTRDESQAVGGGQHDPRTSAPDQRDVGMWGCKSVHDQQMLACGDVRAPTAGRLRTLSWGQYFVI